MASTYRNGTTLIRLDAVVAVYIMQDDKRTFCICVPGGTHFTFTCPTEEEALKQIDELEQALKQI